MSVYTLPADPELKELCQAQPVAYVDGEPRSYITEAGEILRARPRNLELQYTNKPKGVLPEDAKERKKIPLGTGVLDYFPAALAAVAAVSYAGNEQHNPGEELHWSRGKSGDQADTMIRHFIERGTLDTDGYRHSAKMVWRALAILQLELEEAGAPIARGAK
jgi:hypothetical protein